MKKVLLSILTIFIIVGSTKSQTLNVPDNIGTSVNAGRIGIGTTSPHDLLEINEGHLRITHSGAPRIIFNENNLDYWRLLQDGGSIRFDYADNDLFTGYSSGLQLKKDGDIIMNKDKGNVGIGTPNTFGYKLAVNGTIGAKEVNIETTNEWPDYVFSDSYDLKTLKEIETFVNKHEHLPDMPSAKEVEENGINVGEMNAKLLQKIEELTLYIIETNKEVNRKILN